MMQQSLLTVEEVLAGRMTKMELADKLGINKSTITRWKRVPAERVLEIERKTGIPRNEIRPDLYPVEG